MCVDHPCVGLVYEAEYDAVSGEIISISVYDPCGPPWYDCSASRPISMLGVGRAWVHIAAGPEVAEIMVDASAFRIDPVTQEVIRIAPVSPTEEPGVGSLPVAVAEDGSGGGTSWLMNTEAIVALSIALVALAFGATGSLRRRL